MSALNWAIDMGQSCAIGSLEEKVEALEKDMATARAWIEYLSVKVEKLERHNQMMAGGVVNSGDGGYGIGTKEAYDEFVKKRNYEIPNSNS